MTFQKISHNDLITKPMKKIISLFIVTAFIISCSNTVSDQSTLGKLEKERDEYVKKIEDLDAKIAKLQQSILAEGGDLATNIRFTNVIAETITPTSFKHYIEVQGTVESDKNIFIPAEMPGIVQKIYVTEGKKVKKGQLLAQIDASVLESSINELELGLELATTVYERQKRLWDQKIGSEIQYLQTKNQKEGLEKKLATLMEQYSMTKIISPISGIIDEIVIREGEMAIAGFGAIRVVQISGLKVKANVSDKYIQDVTAGDTAYVTIPSTNWEYQKPISVVSKVINPDSRTFSMEVPVPKNGENILYHMLAIIKIKDYVNNDALVVPINVVQNSGSEYFLFVAEKKDDFWIASKRVVVPGKYYDNKIEVLSNLNPGDQVITVGYQDLANGQPIKIVENDIQ